MSTYEPLVQRFWAKVALPDAYGCMLWQAGRNPAGYGVLGFHDNKKILAHRLSALLAYGAPSDARLEAAHGCLNKHCVAPEHLRWASRSENQMDRVRDGASNRGERHGMAKLTWGQVRELRAALAAGAVRTELAAQHGIKRRALYNIERNITWVEAS